MTCVRQLPPILYKYLPAERLEDILIKRTLRFTPPSVFNDPFDVYPFVSMGGTEKVRSLIEMGRNQMRDSFTSIGLRAEHLLGNEATERDRISFLVRSAENRLLEMQSSLRSSFSRQIGVLSLSEVADSTLMWSHYAKNHTGVAVGFNTSSSFFQVDEEGFLAGPVVYSKIRPGFSPKTDLEDEPFFVKSSAWDYEKEWRVVRQLKNATRVIGAGHTAVHLFEFPKGMIAQLIFGCNMAHHDRVRIARVFNKETDGTKASLLHAEADRETFALGLIEDREYRRVRFVHE